MKRARPKGALNGVTTANEACSKLCLKGGQPDQQGVTQPATEDPSGESTRQMQATSTLMDGLEGETTTQQQTNYRDGGT